MAHALALTHPIATYAGIGRGVRVFARLKGRSRIIEQRRRPTSTHTHTRARAHAHCTGATSGPAGLAAAADGLRARARPGARARPSTWWSRATRPSSPLAELVEPPSSPSSGTARRRAREPGREPRALDVPAPSPQPPTPRDVRACRSRACPAPPLPPPRDARRARARRRRGTMTWTPNNPIPSARARPPWPRRRWSRAFVAAAAVNYLSGVA